MFGYSKEELSVAKSKKNNKKKTTIIISALLAAILIVSAALGGVYYYNNVYSKPYGKYDLDDYVKVGKYKGLTLEKTTIDITDEQVKEKVENEVESTASIKEVTSGEVSNGDTINIDYSATVDGKDFEEGSAKNVTLTIGAGEFVAGFESSLIGAKVGKKTTIHINYPEDYTKKNMAGKKVTYEVTVNSKEDAKIPKYNDDWVKENTEYSSKEEYENSVREKLYSKTKKEKITEEKESLWEEVVNSSKVKKYPKEEIERIKTSIVQQYKMYAKQYKMKYVDFLEQQMGMTEKEFKRNLDKYAKDEVKQEEILYWIAKKEEIDVSEKEYKKHIKEVLKDYGYTNKSFEEENGKTYEEYAGELNIYSEIYKDKVIDFIYEQAKKL